MGTKLVIDGNSVYEIDETCQKAGREFWSGSRRGARRSWGRDEEEAGCGSSPGRSGHSLR